MGTPAPAPAAPVQTRSAAPVSRDDDDDNDPFADIDTARKTAPRAAEPPRPQVRSVFDDEETTPVSTSTRDALAAARAAVRATMEPPAEDRSILGGLRTGTSRTRNVQPKPVPKKDEDFVNKAAKASFIAIGATLLFGGGYYGINAIRNAILDKADKQQQQPAEAQIAAAVVSPDVPSVEDQAALQTRFELAEKALAARSPTAVDALKQVANQGYAPAQFRLGGIYSGEGNLVPVNKEEARLWTQRAANGGIAAAMNNLGLMYYNGEGGAQNRSTAAMWFRKAAERGVTNSQYNLGILYQSGDGVPLNPTEAYKWLSIAAKSGDKDAAREARALRGQLSEDQQRQADASIAGFTPISDGAPVASSSTAAG
jgi:localization factor PodJL